MWSFVWLLALTIAQTDPATTQPTSQPAIALPAEIDRALRHNVEQLGPSITIAYTQRGASRFSADEYSQRFRYDLAFADRVVNSQYDGRITWQGERFIDTRVEQLWPTKRERTTETMTNAFNGEEIYSVHLRVPENGDPPEESASAYLLAKLPESMEGASFNYGGMLNLAGYTMPWSIADMGAKAVPRDFVHAMIDDGARLISCDEVELNGEHLVRLRLMKEDPEHTEAMKIDLEQYADELRRESNLPEDVQRERLEYKRKKREQTELLTHIIWLDPKLNYVTRLYECRIGHVLRWRTSYSSFVKVPDRELLFPRKAVFEVFCSNSGPQNQFDEAVHQSIAEVVEISTKKLNDSAFVPKITTDAADFLDYRDDREHPVSIIINSTDGIPPRGR
jgi:hypothetical protein